MRPLHHGKDGITLWPRASGHREQGRSAVASREECTAARAQRANVLRVESARGPRKQTKTR